MSGMQTLRLQDAKDDSPQTRTLLNLFEQDALVMVDYVSQVTSLFQDLIAAQQHSMVSLRALSEKLLEFEKWGPSFPLGRDDSILVLTLQQFGVTLEKLSVVHEVLTRQLTSHITPLHEFANLEKANISRFQQLCQQSEEVHEQVLAKYSRLSKRKELETKACIESTEELHKARRDVLKNTMERYTNLNKLQYKRTTCLLEPFIGAFEAFKQFQTTGTNVHSKDFHDYVGDIKASVSSVQMEMTKFLDKAAAEMVDMDQSSHYYFVPEPTPDMQLKAKPVNKKLHQKGGYLWIRTKSGLSHKWERKYFFTQGSNLMSQGKGEIAGSLIIDLERCIVQPADVDDRRFVFQLNDTVDVKRVVILQAISGSEREEWIYTIRNINTGYANESGTTQKLSPELLPKLPYSEQQNKTSHQPASQPLKLSIPQKVDKGKGDSHHSQKSKSLPKGVPPTPPPSPLDSFLPDTPIQFDMISPVMDTVPLGQQPPPPSPEKNGQVGPPKRINPFNQSSSQIRDDQLKASIPGFIQMFTVRFLGSMQVATDKGSEVIMNTIRNIMTARAIHNIFKTTESNFIITSQNIRIEDLSSKTVKAIIPLQDISFWSAHHENKRWFAFISHARQEGGIQPKFTCQVFETDTLAEDICKSLSMAAEIAFKAAMMQKSVPYQGSQQNNNRRASDPSHGRLVGSGNSGRPTWIDRHRGATSNGSKKAADLGPYTLPREYPPSTGSGQTYLAPAKGLQGTSPTAFQAAYLQPSSTGMGLSPGQQHPSQGPSLVPSQQQPPSQEVGLSPVHQSSPRGVELVPDLQPSTQTLGLIGGQFSATQGHGVLGQHPPLQGIGQFTGETPSQERPGLNGDPSLLPVASLSLQPDQPHNLLPGTERGEKPLEPQVDLNPN